MPDSTSSQGTSAAPIDVSHIQDPDTRRALRAAVQLTQALEVRVRQQQQEIEALLQMMVEKHVGSIGEFKRHMMKLQTGDARGERLHGQITATVMPAAQRPAAAAATATPAPAARPARMPDPDDGDRPRRYTL